MKRTIVGACVIALGAALALAYGSPYGANNQVTYLLDPLARAFPELFHRDWFVTDMHHYHVAFGYLGEPLYRLDPDGAVAFGLAQLVTMVATFAAIYGVVMTVTERARLAIFAGLVGVLVLGGGRSLGGSYLFAGYLQPSSFATLAWLVAMIAWLRERRFAAGIALAIGAVFHLNYAVLGIGVFGLAELCTRTTIKRLAMVVGPSIGVMLVFLPIMIASSHTSDAKHALFVLVRFAFSIHFWPRRVGWEVWALVGWIAIAWAMRPRVPNRARGRLWWFALCSLGCCFAALALAAIPPLLTITRLFVWRIAPFGQCAAILLLVLGVIDIARGDAPRPRGWPLAVLIIGAALIVYNAFERPREHYAEVITCTMAIAAIAIVARRELVVYVACTAACLAALWPERATIASPILFTDPSSSVEIWARTQTPVDALFLVPPYANDFRLLARRAIVVDTKSPPMYLDELVEWYDRLRSVVDAPKLDKIGDVWSRWDALPADRLLSIAHSFHADYLVVSKQRSTARLTVGATLAYEDGSDLVYAITPP